MTQTSTKVPILKATFFVVILGFLVQITGINAVVFYSPLIFKAMGFKGNFALLVLPGIVQVASFIAPIGKMEGNGRHSNSCSNCRLLIVPTREAKR